MPRTKRPGSAPPPEIVRAQRQRGFVLLRAAAEDFSISIPTLRTWLRKNRWLDTGQAERFRGCIWLNRDVVAAKASPGGAR